MTSYYERPYFQTCGGEDEECLGPRHHAKTIPATPTKPISTQSKPSSNPSKTPVPKCILEPLLKQALDKWIPKPQDHTPNKKILRDAIFPRIQELLMQYGKAEWSLLPRTFAILQMLGCPEVLDQFVAQKRSDSFLPYNAGNLPNALNGALRSKFLKLQRMVLCNQRDVKALEDGGKHVHLNGPGDNYFEFVEKLGRGTYGTVDRVRSRQTLKTYARKLIHRGASVASDSRMYRQFEGEIQVLKRLSHPHIVKLVGSYTDEDNLGLIMTPIADMNLEEYLTSQKLNSILRNRSLPEYFGCLATALAYLHQQDVRHNDIKPRNVLVKDARVYLADFGTSRSWGAEEVSTTVGPHEGFTPRYSAPETHDTNTPRNRASDMWSLGCVYLEMATVLMGRTLDELDRFLSENGSLRVDAFYANPEAIALWIEQLRKGSSRKGDGVILDWTASLLQISPDDRPTAAQLRGRIAEHRSRDAYICHSCASQHGLKPQETGVVVAISSSEGHSESGSSDSESGESDSDDARTVDSMTTAPSVDRDREVTAEKGVAAEGISAESLDVENTGVEKLPETCDATPETNLADISSEAEGSVDTVASPVQDSSLSDQSESPPPYQAIDPASTDDTPAPAPERPPPNTETRFILLPRNRRPEPIQQDPEENPAVDGEFIPPEPVKPPSFLRQDPVPKSTLVPSYVLAGKNRFSQSELTTPPDGTTTNLFVYGRLMFPSVLSAIAAQSTKGVYSTKWRRRLLPSSEDWSKIDLSIRRASEAMTPARLEGYDRFRPRGLNCAVIQDANSTPRILRRRKIDGHYDFPFTPPGHVEGFLILGLRSEAIRYCDLLFGSDRRTIHTLRPQDDADRDDSDSDSDFNPPSPLLRRCTVPVQVQTLTGEITTVVADTYVWAGRTSELTNIWEEERFLRSAPMQKVLEAQPTWAKEEQALAKTMKTSFALVGDYLVAPIQTGNMRELRRLLDDKLNPNAECRVYGHPLQAAAAAGRAEMVKMLLGYGANVNTVGGQYGTPLIASTCTSRKAITKLLLKNGADVFASDNVHVNALYQAVANGDYAVAEILLEHGAWLGRDWYETKDLAEERGDEDFQALLDSYDVRKIHRAHVAAGCRYDRREIEDNADDSLGSWEGVRYSKVTLAVVRKAAAVQGDSGSWRGKRGVAVTVAALDAGAPLRLIGMLRKAVAPLQAIIEILRKGDEEQERKRLAASQKVDAVDSEVSKQGSARTTGKEGNVGRSSRRGISGSFESMSSGVEGVEYGSQDFESLQPSPISDAPSWERRRRVRFVDPT
ncbi:hypothetical protein QBC34DRAFT_416886 [Podospora aff. communis PSN243]|uniref:Protein kinase domain-containing protein n=1 Tax=Podospora aff. communis PSN243 TaxID=3040156 RepID=A0AAV9G8V2_9PEZI|nr:hypothetical protein QBC34DRAFT_416886 [Podospora aff. communis PSN243]